MPKSKITTPKTRAAVAPAAVKTAAPKAPATEPKIRIVKGGRKPAAVDVKGGRTPSDADVKCRELLERDGGATVAEIRKATGWKGVIKGGPARVAKALGRKLAEDGEGEDKRFTLA